MANQAGRELVTPGGHDVAPSVLCPAVAAWWEAPYVAFGTDVRYLRYDVLQLDHRYPQVDMPAQVDAFRSQSDLHDPFDAGPPEGWANCLRRDNAGRPCEADGLSAPLVCGLLRQRV